MLKKEIIYREMLTEALESKILSFTQLALSRKFNFSLSTVNNALKPLEQIGAIEKRERSFQLVDVHKLLTFWATTRNLSRDILYSTRAEMPVQKIEGNMPAGAAFTAYSGYRFLFNEAPADYGEAYVYADEKTLEEIKERFPETGNRMAETRKVSASYREAIWKLGTGKGPPNVFVLEKDAFMPERIAPKAQIYADLWNLKEWYAKDFLNALERRLFG